jgi:hypothetical protein
LIPVTLLSKQNVEVFVDGTIVVLKVGNSELRLGYEDAIKLSTWMRVRGKQAKARAGDHSRHWSIIGNLTAVENGERPW